MESQSKYKASRTPKFKKTTAIYPDIEIQKWEWKDLFKEGINQNNVDETTIRASSIINGELFYEEYIKSYKDAHVPNEHIENILRKKLRTNEKNKTLQSSLQN